MIKSIISYHRLMRISSLKVSNSTKIILLSVLVSPIIGDSLWIPVLICIATLFKIRKINFETPQHIAPCPTDTSGNLSWMVISRILIIFSSNNRCFIKQIFVPMAS